MHDAGKIQSLKRVKEDISEAKNGSECGIRILDFDDLQEGDIIYSYKVNSRPRKLGERIPPKKDPGKEFDSKDKEDDDDD
jgi:translation initiation factor IF-2